MDTSFQIPIRDNPVYLRWDIVGSGSIDGRLLDETDVVNLLHRGQFDEVNALIEQLRTDGKLTEMDKVIRRQQDFLQNRAMGFTIPVNRSNCDSYARFNVSRTGEYFPNKIGMAFDQPSVNQHDVAKLLNDGRTDEVDALIEQLRTDGRLEEMNRVMLIKSSFENNNLVIRD